MFGGSISHLIV